MLRKLAYILFTLLLVAGTVACGRATATPAATAPTSAVAGATYKVGMNAEYPPFEFVDSAGRVVGFDPDLLDAISQKTGIQFELVNTRWDGIFVALQSGEFDAVASAATITDERAQIVDFSDPYFNAGQMIAVRIEDRDRIKTVADLDGKPVGVQLGTTGDIWLTENTRAQVARYDEITLAFQALKNRDIDAVFNDGPVSAEIIRANPELNATLVGDPVTDEFYGIAVNKGKPELLVAINAALQTMRADGTYDRLYEKWFGTP